jgi:hypothetical protein
VKSDQVLLAHVRDAVERILRYTMEGRDAFFSDTKTQDAVIRNIEIIGEASKSRSESLRSGSGDVPWKQICGMRDALIHHYFGVKLELVWEVVERDLPGFHKRVEELLATAFTP